MIKIVELICQMYEERRVLIISFNFYLKIFQLK